MADTWEAAERVQKNAAGQYRALINGEWVPVAQAQKNAQGAFRVQRATPVAPATPTVSAEMPEESTRGLGEETLRQLQLFGRSALEGVGNIADLVTSPLVLPVNAMAKRQVIPEKSGRALADWIGLVRPESEQEQLVGKGATAVAEALVPMGLAQQSLKTASGATKEVLKLLAAQPAGQAILASLGGVAGESVRQSGGNEFEQAGAAAVAPIVASLGGSAAQSAGRLAKNILTAPFASGAKKAAGRIAVDVAGDTAPEIAMRLRAGAPPETAAQAAMPAGRAEFAGLEKTVASRKPSAYAGDGSVARGATEWQQTQRGLQNAADEALRVPLFSQADDVGLDVADLSMEVARLKNASGYKDETSTQVLKWLDKELVRRADPETARISGADLYDLRRDLGRKIAAKTADTAKPWDKAKATSLLRKFQMDIDHQIETAIGSDAWTKGLLQPSAQRRGELAAIADRVEETARMGAAGAPEARRISRLDEEPLTLPNLLSRPMMATNAVLRFLQGKGGEKTTKTLADLMLPENKVELAKLIEAEMARRAKRGQLSDLLPRAGVQSYLQGSAALSEHEKVE